MLGIVDQLPLNGNVLIFDIFMLDWYIFDIAFRDNLRNITSDVLNGIIIGRYDFSWHNINSDVISIISDCSFSGDKRVSCFVNIVNYFFFDWDILYSACSFN